MDFFPSIFPFKYRIRNSNDVREGLSTWNFQGLFLFFQEMKDVERLNKLSDFWVIAWIKSNPQTFQGFFAANVYWPTDSQMPQK